jgi:hypothetical protein
MFPAEPRASASVEMSPLWPAPSLNVAIVGDEEDGGRRQREEDGLVGERRGGPSPTEVKVVVAVWPGFIFSWVYSG